MSGQPQNPPSEPWDEHHSAHFSIVIDEFDHDHPRNVSVSTASIPDKREFDGLLRYLAKSFSHDFFFIIDEILNTLNHTFDSCFPVPRFGNNGWDTERDIVIKLHIGRFTVVITIKI
jgi:hypothetical protein